MMTETTTTTFSERLVASRLLDADRIQHALKAVSGDEQALLPYLVREGVLTRFQARQLQAGAYSFHVDKYVVLDCIGRGGNGVVFKARHSLLAQRYVALKTIDANNLHHGSDAVARFRREIDIVTRLEHPNIVRAYDVVRTRTQWFLVLEYVDGRDLSTLVRERGPLAVLEAIDFTVQAARGLAHAHKCGVIHRDIKPGNLLLTRDNVVKLSDLGLARTFGQGDDEELSMKGLCLGTPEFMAPEQAEDSTRADARSDIYSLGATLFHLLTAELPITGSSQLHRLQRLLTLPPRPLGQARPDAPPALAKLVDRMRLRNPADRPATAEEVVALLEPFCRPEPPPAAAPQPWDAKRKARLIVEVLQGKVGALDACNRFGLALEEYEEWQRQFLEAGERSLDPQAISDLETARQRVRDLHTKIGAQAMEIEDLRRQLAGR